MMLKKIGWGFVILGLIEAVISGVSCKSLCQTCTAAQIKPCFFLFIFVSIIFIISGLSIISLQEAKLPKVKLAKGRGKK